MNTRVLAIKAKNCTGCHLCELACSSAKEGLFIPIRSRIKVITDGLNGCSSPVVCVQCKDPLCLAVCSVEAIFESETSQGDKFIDINKEKCIACHKCVVACPFGAIEYIKDVGIVKCDLCGGKPICVDYCFYDCLEFIELTEEQYQKRVTKINVLAIKACRKISKKEPTYRRTMFSLDLSKI
jgi:carbon-monoxide dehydrogenase iron sulfur subunit